MVVSEMGVQVLSVNWSIRVSFRLPTAVSGSCAAVHDIEKPLMEDLASPMSMRMYHTEERSVGRMSCVSLVQVLSMPMEYAAPSGSGVGSGVSVPGTVRVAAAMSRLGSKPNVALSSIPMTTAWSVPETVPRPALRKLL